MAQIQFDLSTGSPSGTNSQGYASNWVQSAGSSIGSSWLRVTVDDANCPSKTEMYKALDALRDMLAQRTYPGLSQ
jgi:hypothetical protein